MGYVWRGFLIFSGRTRIMAKKIFQNPISEDNKKYLFGCAFEMQLQ